MSCVQYPNADRFINAHGFHSSLEMFGLPEAILRLVDTCRYMSILVGEIFLPSIGSSMISMLVSISML